MIEKSTTSPERPLSPERRTVIRLERRSEMFPGWGVRF